MTIHDCESGRVGAAVMIPRRGVMANMTTRIMPVDPNESAQQEQSTASLGQIEHVHVHDCIVR